MDIYLNSVKQEMSINEIVVKFKKSFIRNMPKMKDYSTPSEYQYNLVYYLKSRKGQYDYIMNLINHNQYRESYLIELKGIIDLYSNYL